MFIVHLRRSVGWVSPAFGTPAVHTCARPIDNSNKPEGRNGNEVILASRADESPGRAFQDRGTRPVPFSPVPDAIGCDALCAGAGGARLADLGPPAVWVVDYGSSLPTPRCVTAFGKVHLDPEIFPPIWDDSQIPSSSLSFFSVPIFLSSGRQFVHPFHDFAKSPSSCARPDSYWRGELSLCDQPINVGFGNAADSKHIVEPHQALLFHSVHWCYSNSV